MHKSQLAINSVSTRGGLEESLAAYAAAGFTQVEFVLGPVKEYITGGHSVADVLRLLDGNGLRCIGGFDCGVEAFSEPESRTINRARIRANADLLQELGGTNLVVGTDGPRTPHTDPLGQLAEAMAEVALDIAETGVNLCIEFNWSPLVKSFRTAAEVARRSDAPNVGVLFDPAHYHCTPSKFEELTLPNIATIKHVHVDDMADKPGELCNCNSDRRLPGEGCLNLKALFDRIEEGGYRGAFSIEMFSEELWNLPVAEAARRMYKSLLTLCD